MRGRTAKAWVLVLTAGLAAAAVGAGRPDLVEKVRRGELAEAKASWWGFDPADSTAALQAALGSGAKRIVIDRMDAPWTSGPLKGASDQEVVFEPGVEIVAKEGLFRGRTESLLAYVNTRNVKVSGGTLRMRRDDYRKAPYEESEWRHALLLHHVENVTVEKMLLTESGGDGIYLNDGRNVTVRDTVCDRNYRQGISVISAEDLLIERCRLTNTEGGLPMAGIDFEPNNPNERLVNCVMRDCVIEGNAGSGIDFALVWFNGTTRDVSMRFENVRISGNAKCIDLVTFNSPANAVRGDIGFRNCSFGYDTSKVGIRLFESDDMPIRLHFGEGCRIVETTDGRTVEKPIGDEWVAARFPHRSAQRVAYPPRFAHDFARHTVIRDAKPGEMVGLSPLRLRFALTLVFHAAKAGEVHFTLKQHRDPRRPTPTDNPIRLLDADGREIGTYRTGGIGYDPSPLTVTVPAAGFYLLDFNVPSLYPVASDVPVAIDVSRRQANMNGLPGALWCFVPDGTDSFAFFVAGDRGEERVKPTITDAAGNVVWMRDDVNSYVSYLSDRPANPGLWKIDFARPTRGGLDDYKCEMHGLPPFLFLSPEKYWE